MSRYIDADALKENCYKKMDELMESTSEHLSAEALSLLCGFTLIDFAPSINIDRPQGEVDAVETYEKAERQLERSEITIGEFEKIVEPLRHLFYNRPQGEWISKGKRTYRCSNCGNYLDFDGVNAGRGDANFCPNCGAQMKGADNADHIE